MTAPSPNVNAEEALRTDRDELCEIVEAQADDEGLWFVAQTAPEGYLQQELRRLHAAVEDYLSLAALSSTETARLREAAQALLDDHDRFGIWRLPHRFKALRAALESETER